VPQSLEAGLPPLKLTDGYRIVFEARDPTTGMAVAGVTVSDTILFAEIEGDISLVQSGPFLLVPGPSNVV
jgi:hypothetical protein